MIELGSKARVLVNWNVSMYDYSKDKEKEFAGVLKEYNNGKITIVTQNEEQNEFLKTDV